MPITLCTRTSFLRLGEQVIDLLFSLSSRAPAVLATISLLFWYPFAHLYGYHSAIGNIPRALDGVFGVASLVVTALLAVHLAGRLAVRDVPRTALVAIAAMTVFLIVTLSWAVVHYGVAFGLRGDVKPLTYHSEALLTYAFLFLVGIYAAPQHFGRWWILLFAGIVLNTLLHMRWDRLMIDLTRVTVPQYSGMYLALSTAAMVTGIMAWSVAHRTWLRVSILIVLAMLLFVLGSRANFAGFLMALPVAIAFTLSIGGQVLLYSVLLSGCLIGFQLLGGMEVFEGSRQLELLNLSEAGSWISRNEIMMRGIEQIIQSPVYGGYAGQLETARGSIGSYIHNFLSVWRTFGLLPFLIYSGFILWGCVFALQRLWIQGRNAPREVQLTAVLAVLMAVLVVAAKSFGWAHVALSWGLLVGCSLRREMTERTTVSARGSRMGIEHA